MACGASALAAVLLPQAVVNRSAAKRLAGRISGDVLAKNRDILLLIKPLSLIVLHAAAALSG